MVDSSRLKGALCNRARPFIGGAVCALVAAAAVMLATAGWIILRGEYPEHARKLSIPLTGVTVRTGSVNEKDDFLRVIPDSRGVAVVLFDKSSWFLADQFHVVQITTTKGTAIQRAEWVWLSRAYDETQLEPLQRNGRKFRAHLEASESWRDRINGIGVVLSATTPVTIKDISLRPPNPSMRYLLKRIWAEWAFREGYHGYTINGLHGAGHATILPIGLGAGFSLVSALALLWLIHILRPEWLSSLRSAMLAALVVLWACTVLPWAHELWTETFWSLETYVGKTETERKLSESDGYLFSLAERVKDVLPSPSERIFVISSGTSVPGSTNFERTKLHYYLAPHNVQSLFRYLPKPQEGSVLQGDYVLVLDEAHPSYFMEKGKINPGYSVKLIEEINGARLYLIERRPNA